MTTGGGDTSIFVDTRSVQGTGSKRVVSAVFIKWRSHPRQSEAVRLEMDCSALKYRRVGQDRWLDDDPKNVRSVCRGDYSGLPRPSDEDIARWRSGGALYSGKQAADFLFNMITGAGGAPVGSTTGKAILGWCGHDNQQMKESCSWYIDGFREAARSLGAICDQKAAKTQVVEGLLADLRKKSEAELGRPGSELVLRHLKATYRCR